VVVAAVAAVVVVAVVGHSDVAKLEPPFVPLQFDARNL